MANQFATKYLFKVFIEHLSFGLIIPFSIIWMLEQGLSLTQVGVVQSVIFFSTFLLEIPTGIIADRYGRKTSLLLGAFFHTCGLILLVVSQSFWLFLLGAVFTGIAWAFVSGAEESYVYDTISSKNDAHYKDYFARITIADEASTILGMLLGSLLVAWLTLSSVFIVAAFLMFVVFLYLGLALPTDVTRARPEIFIKESPKTLFVLVTNYQPFILMFIMLAIFFESARVLWQPGLLGLGWSVGQLGMLFASLKLFSIIGSIIAQRVSISPIRMMVISSVGGGLALLGLSSGSAWLGVLGLGAYFLLENILRINQSAYLLTVAPSKNAVTFLSGASLVRNLASSIVNPLLGWSASYSMSLTLSVLLGIKLVASTIFIKVSKQGHKT